MNKRLADFSFHRLNRCMPFLVLVDMDGWVCFLVNLLTKSAFLQAKPFGDKNSVIELEEGFNKL
jgi:hypothetical protein